MKSSLLPNRRAITLALASLAASQASARAIGAALPVGNKWAAINTIIADAVARKLIPGIAIAVFRHGKPIYGYAAGWASLELNVPMTENSILMIGSLTKQFTAAAVLLLAEDGRLSLGDQLSRFIPEFPRANEITLREMLNHTAGLGDYLDTYIDDGDYNDAKLIKCIIKVKQLFVFPPGTRWSYSNTGYALLGIVIARASRMPYRDFLAARIFHRLGLNDTAVDDGRSVVSRRAAGYTPNSKAASGFDNGEFVARSFIAAAGGIRSTARDLCQWHSALLSGKLLKPESLKQMLAPARLKNGFLPQDRALVMSDGSHDEYGMGLFLSQKQGHLQVAHGGGGYGFSSYLFSIPDKGVTAARLVNCDDGGEDVSPSDAPLSKIDTLLTEFALS